MNERSARGERDHLGRVLPVLKIRYRDRPRYFFWQLFFFDDVALNQEKKANGKSKSFLRPVH